jgi:hypothetical protein
MVSINAKKEPMQIKVKRENYQVTAFEAVKRDSKDDILAD